MANQSVVRYHVKRGTGEDRRRHYEHTEEKMNIKSKIETLGHIGHREQRREKGTNRTAKVEQMRLDEREIERTEEKNRKERTLAKYVTRVFNVQKSNISLSNLACRPSL